MTRSSIRLAAHAPAGLFYGVQTLRQLVGRGVPAVRIRDRPRFAWRGAMLDVARHFFGGARRRALHRPDRALQAQPPAPAPVRRPGLADRDRHLAAAGDARRQHRGRRRHAAATTRRRSTRPSSATPRHRYITVVPEIDMPGHINAALASYPSSNCDGKPPPLYTGIDVGFSSLCVAKEITYSSSTTWSASSRALTPGPYFHIGGDEAHGDDAGRLRDVHRARAGDRGVARQAHDRLGGDRAREARAARSRSTGIPAREGPRSPALAAQAGR